MVETLLHSTVGVYLYHISDTADRDDTGLLAVSFSDMIHESDTVHIVIIKHKDIGIRSRSYLSTNRWLAILLSEKISDEFSLLKL